MAWILSNITESTLALWMPDALYQHYTLNLSKEQEMLPVGGKLQAM